jgi:hypothetical protein
MPTPRLFYGRRLGVALLQSETTVADDGQAYDLLLRSDRIVPAGFGGEAIFPVLYLATTHYAANVTLFVTPYVDSVALDTQQVVLVGVPGSSGEHRVHELALHQPFLVDGIERLRTAPRGTFFQVKVETRAGLGSPIGLVEIDLIDVEVEVVREGDTAGEVAR